MAEVSPSSVGPQSTTGETPQGSVPTATAPTVASAFAWPPRMVACQPTFVMPEDADEGQRNVMMQLHHQAEELAKYWAEDHAYRLTQKVFDYLETFKTQISASFSADPFQ